MNKNYIIKYIIKNNTNNICSSYIPFAKKKCFDIQQELNNDIKADDIKVYNLLDVLITIKTSGIYQTVYIDSKNSCYEFFNGLTTTNLLTKINNTYKFNSFYPSAYQQELNNNLLNSFQYYDNLSFNEDEDAISKNLQYSEYNSNYTVRYSQQYYIYSSQFTGEMSKVVQILLGSKKLIHYSSNFYKTHTILTTKDNRKWICQIGNDGVYIKLLDICDTKNTISFNELGYTPMGKQFVIDEKTTQLLSADDMKEFYLNSYFLYQNSSWASNKSGKILTNNCYKYEDNYKKFYRYEIQFNEVKNNNDDYYYINSCNLTKKDEGFMWYDIFESSTPTQIKIPQKSFGNQLITFDAKKIGIQNFDDRILDAPIFSYFDEDDELVNLKYYRKKYNQKIYKNTLNNIEVNYNNNNLLLYKDSYGDYVNFGEIKVYRDDATYYDIGFYCKNLNYRTTIPSGYYSYTKVFSNNQKVNDSKSIIEKGLNEDNSILLTINDRPTYAKDIYGPLETYQEIGIDNNEINYEHIIINNNNRSSFVIYRYNKINDKVITNKIYEKFNLTFKNLYLINYNTNSNNNNLTFDFIFNNSTNLDTIYNSANNQNTFIKTLIVNDKDTYIRDNVYLNNLESLILSTQYNSQNNVNESFNENIIFQCYNKNEIINLSTSLNYTDFNKNTPDFNQVYQFFNFQQDAFSYKYCINEDLNKLLFLTNINEFNNINNNNSINFIGIPFYTK